MVKFLSLYVHAFLTWDWFSYPMAHIPEPNPHWLIKRTKQFFNLIKYCCASKVAFVYGLFGRFPLEFNKQCRIMSYWPKVVTGCKPIYVSQLYQASLSRLDNTTSQNWAREIKHLLCSVGFGDVWYNQGAANPEVSSILSESEHLTSISKIGTQAYKLLPELDFSDRLLKNINFITSST